MISGMGGIGAAAGPLIGGRDHHHDQLAGDVSAARRRSWRPSSCCSAAGSPIRCRRTRPASPSTSLGAVLSAAGMFFIVDRRSCRSAANGAARRQCSFALRCRTTALVLPAHPRARTRAGTEPLLSTGLFQNRTSNLALVTQNVQWLMLMGISFVVSVFLQVVRGLQRDRNRPRLHRGNGRHPHFLAGRRAAGQAPCAEAP